MSKVYDKNISKYQSSAFLGINEIVDFTLPDNPGNAHQIIVFALEHIDIPCAIGKSDKGVVGIVVYPEGHDGTEVIPVPVILACAVGVMATLKAAELNLETKKTNGRVTH